MWLSVKLPAYYARPWGPTTAHPRHIHHKRKFLSLLIVVREEKSSLGGKTLSNMNKVIRSN